MKMRVLFTFQGELVKEPIIYQLGKNYNVVTNIRRADVADDQGWVILELDGEEKEIEAGLAWVASLGVRVDHALGEVIEG